MVIVSPPNGVIPPLNGLNGLKKGATNHLLSGMILQVGTMFSQRFSQHVSSWAWKSWNEKKQNLRFLRLKVGPRNLVPETSTTSLKSRWWQLNIFYFTPTWGDDPIWRAYFSNGLVQPPTRNGWSKSVGWWESFGGFFWFETSISCTKFCYMSWIYPPFQMKVSVEIAYLEDGLPFRN